MLLGGACLPASQNASQLSRKSAAAKLSVHFSVHQLGVHISVQEVYSVHLSVQKSVHCATQCAVCKKCAAAQLMQDMRRQFVAEVLDKFEYISP